MHKLPDGIPLDASKATLLVPERPPVIMTFCVWVFFPLFCFMCDAIVFEDATNDFSTRYSATKTNAITYYRPQNTGDWTETKSEQSNSDAIHCLLVSHSRKCVECIRVNNKWTINLREYRGTETDVFTYAWTNVFFASLLWIPSRWCIS